MDYLGTIASILTTVTFETQRYVFGLILNMPRISSADFLNPPAAAPCHTIRTRCVLNGVRGKVQTERYLNNAIAPTSVVMWFWRRTNLFNSIHPLLFTGYHYQSLEQFRAFIGCNFDFFTVERYVNLFYVYRRYIIGISVLYCSFIQLSAIF